MKKNLLMYLSEVTVVLWTAWSDTSKVLDYTKEKPNASNKVTDAKREAVDSIDSTIAKLNKLKVDILLLTREEFEIKYNEGK